MLNYALIIDIPHLVHRGTKLSGYQELGNLIENAIGKKLSFTNIHSSYEYTRIIHFCESLSDMRHNQIGSDRFEDMNDELTYLLAVLGNKYLIKFTRFEPSRNT